MGVCHQGMQVRLQYSDWLWPAIPSSGCRERQHVACATDLGPGGSLAMVNTHPSESVASRRAGLDPS